MNLSKGRDSGSRQAATERISIVNNPREKTISVTKTYKSGSHGSSLSKRKSKCSERRGSEADNVTVGSKERDVRKSDVKSRFHMENS